MKIMLSFASDEPKRFKDIFPPFDMPEPDFRPDELVPNQKNRINVSKYSDPKYGFFGESFARMLESERARGGKTNGPKEES